MPLLQARDYAESMILDELRHYARDGGQRVELTVMSHGAGTQTSVLLMLAARSYRFTPGQPGYLPLDLAIFAKVGDEGQECEWPETIAYLERLHYVASPSFPFLQLFPHYWNPWLATSMQPMVPNLQESDVRGLYDRYVARETIPVRMYRSCTDWFKVRPQINFLTWLHDEAAQLGIDLRVRQVIGYSADEVHRAEKFEPEREWITPYFPLIEWGWGREKTLRKFEELLPQIAATLGPPQKSGCWYCPFQKRGKYDPVTMEPTPRSWMALRDQHPDLYEKAVHMERVNNARREAEGKKPIYLYGHKPLDYWTRRDKTVTQTGFEFLHDEDPGEQKGDDLCSWGCFI